MGRQTGGDVLAKAYDTVEGKATDPANTIHKVEGFVLRRGGTQLFLGSDGVIGKGGTEGTKDTELGPNTFIYASRADAQEVLDQGVSDYEIVSYDAEIVIGVGSYEVAEA